jgi:hypothetical protein
VRELESAALLQRRFAEQGRAIREALESVLAWGRARKAPEVRPATRLLVIVDDFHRLEPRLARTFLENFIGGMGLRATHGVDLRIVLGFASGAHDTIDRLTAETTIDWLGRTNVPERRKLGRFADADAQLAYEHYLLGFRSELAARPLAIVPAAREHVFRVFHGQVAGLPSKMKDAAPVVAGTLISLSQMGHHYVEPADDEVALQQARSTS